MTLEEGWSHRFNPSFNYVVVDQSNSPDSLGWICRNLLLMISIYSGALDSGRYELDHKCTIKSMGVNIIALRNPIFRKWKYDIQRLRSMDEELCKHVFFISSDFHILQ
jgi:hypothetical protein